MKRQRGTVVGLSLVALAATTGCTDDDCGTGEPVRVATFNAGLAESDVDYVQERDNQVVEALAAEQLDVLCVQEFWKHYFDFLVRNVPDMPHTVHLPSWENCPTGCTAAELAPALACAATHCDGLCGVELLGCARFEYCEEDVTQLPSGCLACVTDHGFAGACLDEIEQQCVKPDDEVEESFLYECSYDTGILSRLPIAAQESRELDSYLVLAAVDFARVETESGEMDVYCTHLQSEMSFAYEGDHGDWKGEQAAQIDQVLAFIDEKSDGSRPVVLLGDLNTGPGRPADGIVGEWPEHYDRLLAAGFEAPCGGPSAPCTICSDNTLRSTDSDDKLIDHILIKHGASEATCSRFMTETISIEVDGAPVETSYSDHYGQVMQLGAWCNE